MYLSSLFQAALRTNQSLKLDSSLGSPPFQSPNIAKCLINFAILKSKASPSRYQQYHDFGAMIVQCLDYWHLPTPKVLCDFLSLLSIYVPSYFQVFYETEDHREFSETERLQYRIDYLRWLQHSSIPSLCPSLKKHMWRTEHDGKTAYLFGYSLLRLIFSAVRRDLIKKCEGRDRDVMTDYFNLLEVFILLFRCCQSDVFVSG